LNAFCSFDRLSLSSARYFCTSTTDLWLTDSFLWCMTWVVTAAFSVIGYVEWH